MEKMTLPDWMRDEGPFECHLSAGGRPQGFIGKTLKRLATGARGLLASDERASKTGFMHKLEPRSRLFGVVFLIMAAAVAEGWAFLVCVLALAAGLSVATRVPAGRLARRALPAFVFTMALSVPVVFRFITPGTEILGSGPFAVTAEGVRGAMFFVLRVTAMASIASLAALTTGQADFFRGLRGIVPGFFVTALFFTHRYCLILLKVAEDAALARRSRTMGRAQVREARRWFASRAAFLLKRSLNTAEEVSLSMASRGFNGRVARAPASIPGPGELAWLGATSFIFFLSFGL